MRSSRRWGRGVCGEASRFFALRPRRRQQRGGEFFIKAEQVLDAGAVGIEGFAAVELVDGGIEIAVGAAQIGGHEIGIVEIGERRARMRRARIEHGLRQRADFLPGLVVRLGPGEGVVDAAD